MNKVVLFYFILYLLYCVLIREGEMDQINTLDVNA